MEILIPEKDLFYVVVGCATSMGGNALVHRKPGCSCSVQGRDDADDALTSHLALIFSDISYSRMQWHYLLHLSPTLASRPFAVSGPADRASKTQHASTRSFQALGCPCILA